VVISYITKLDLVVNYSILNAINEENKVSVIIWRISPTTGAQFVILTLISFMAGFYFINLLKIKKD